MEQITIVVTPLCPRKGENKNGRIVVSPEIRALFCSRMDLGGRILPCKEAHFTRLSHVSGDFKLQVAYIVTQYVAMQLCADAVFSSVASPCKLESAECIDRTANGDALCPPIG